MSRIPDRATALRCLNRIPKLLAIYEPESPKLREDVIDSIDILTRTPSQSAKEMIAEGLVNMRRKGYFDGGLMVQDIAKKTGTEIEEVQDFLTALLEVCKQSSEGEG
jgi:hypothetical protein